MIAKPTFSTLDIGDRNGKDLLEDDQASCDECNISSWNVSYDSLLGSYKPFPQPIIC